VLVKVERKNADKVTQAIVASLRALAAPRADPHLR
jgi:hypothetical protein